MGQPVVTIGNLAGRKEITDLFLNVQILHQDLEP
jgi:hypothetical protein